MCGDGPHHDCVGGCLMTAKFAYSFVVIYSFNKTLFAVLCRSGRHHGFGVVAVTSLWSWRGTMIFI
jgi:hypothetical protein